MRGDFVKDGPGETGFAVVIPTYNRAAHVKPCLAPFLRDMARGIEVIVIDDGSTDGTQQQVEAAAGESRGATIRYVRQANAGPSAARNRGAAMVRSRWIVFLDVDDRWFDWTIPAIRDALHQAPGAAIVFFRMLSFCDETELQAALPGPIALRWFDGFYRFDKERPGWAYGIGNSAIPAELYRAVGGLDETIRGHEDHELFYRLAGSGPVLRVDGPALVAYRTNSSDSLSANPAHMRAGLDRIVAGLRQGRYPEPTEELAALVNARRLLWCRQYFARGWPGPAYRLLLPNMGYLIRQWGAGVYFRTLLTPILALVKPATYRFDWAGFSRGGAPAG